MKNIYLLLLMSFGFSMSMMAQEPACEPISGDSIPPDALGIFPDPYNPATGEGTGISDTACLNSYFEYTLTVIVPKITNSLPLDSIVVDSTSAVKGLPMGMNYACDPPSCVFTYSPEDSLGCILISGTATDTVNIGDNPLAVEGVEVFAAGFPDPFVVVNFPGEEGSVVPIPIGEFNLVVEQEGADNCTDFTSSINDQLSTVYDIRNIPNPFSYETKIAMHASKGQVLDFQVYNLISP